LRPLAGVDLFLCACLALQCGFFSQKTLVWPQCLSGFSVWNIGKTQLVRTLTTKVCLSVFSCLLYHLGIILLLLYHLGVKGRTKKFSLACRHEFLAVWVIQHACVFDL
jgi:hypothetical protein